MIGRFFTIVLVLGLHVQAQYVVKVDSSISRNADKSMLTALGLSLVAPGSGLHYLGEEKRMRPYLWTDASLWATVFASYFAGEAYLSSAQSYARRHAGAQPPREFEILDVISKYRSRSGVQGQNSSPDNNEDYNQAQIRAGLSPTDQYPATAAYSWDWGSSDNPETTRHMDEYEQILGGYRKARIVTQIAIGALLLNRVVASVDALRTYRRTSARGGITVVPNLDPELPGGQLVFGF